MDHEYYNALETQAHFIIEIIFELIQLTGA